LKDLNSFLTQEIKLESETRKELPKITGFTTKLEGPNVTLTRSHNGETITVKLNINGSLDNSEPNVEDSIENVKAGKEPEPSMMKSRPNFSVELKRTNQVLSFGCSFLPSEGEKDVGMFDFLFFKFHLGQFCFKFVAFNQLKTFKSTNWPFIVVNGTRMFTQPIAQF
jgi:complement component 1 Q subcomponent-binding protein